MKKITLLLFFFIVNILFGKSILIISSYHDKYEWTNLCLQGIIETFDNKYDTKIFFMDTKRISPEKFNEKAELAWNMYLEEKPDLVMLGDDNALKLLANKFGKTDTPVVYFGINNNPRKYFSSHYTNITGILERPPILLYYRVLKNIIPDAKRSLILFENTTSSRIDASIFKETESLEVEDLKIDHEVISDWEHWKKTIFNSNEKYDFIVLSGFFGLKNKEGFTIKDTDVVEWTSANLDIPVFTHHDYTVYDNGATGAMTIKGYTHGKLAGTIALDILENKKNPKLILPQTDKTAKLYFNIKQIKEFNITVPSIYKVHAVFK